MSLIDGAVPRNVHSTPFLGPLIENSLATLSGPPESPSSKTVPAAVRKDVGAKAPPKTELRVVHGPEDVPDCVNVSGRVIFATTNLPHVLVRDSASRKIRLAQRRGNSALYSAISHLHRETPWKGVLVGWPGEVEVDHQERVFADEIDSDPHELSEADRADVQSQLDAANDGMTVAPVWMDDNGQPERWRAYAENTVWPTLHYLQGEATDGQQEKQWWADYVKFNEAYRDVIVSQYRPGDIIWIHDYYLFLLPQMIRMRLPDAHIGLFVHAPVPSSEYFRCLSKRRELLEGMLGATLVGTQSSAYTRHFISCCARLLGVESSPHHVSAFGTVVTVRTIPIGIDTVRVERDAFRESVSEKVRAIRELYPDKKIIVGRDRLDSVRGVVQKLQAFEEFLQRYPEYQDKVVLIQVTSPAYSGASKTEVKVSELIARINGTYGSLHFAPVHHYPQHIARDEYYALLRVADLGLITSVRDGMNTTSLEFVVCQKENCSPIILSEFTGTAGSLHDAIQVNPWDTVQVADTIRNCLEMRTSAPQKMIQSHRRLYNYVTTHTVQHWVQYFVSTLMSNLEHHDRSHVTPMLDSCRVVDSYKEAPQRLFLFDYDGTLSPIVREPSAAIPSARLYKVLERLTADPRNRVWIISGRDADFLDTWLASKNPKLGFSAEHGCFVKPAGQSSWVDLTTKVDMSWQKLVSDIFNSYTERTPGASIEHKKASLTWHYRRADPDFGVFQAGHLRAHLEDTVGKDYNVEIMSGKANIEVRPREFNKGEIVKRLVKDYAKKPEFVFCIGDDYTDEDMFRALSDVGVDQGFFPITVGPPSKMTTARWHLLDPQSVIDTLYQLVDSSPAS